MGITALFKEFDAFCPVSWPKLTEMNRKNFIKTAGAGLGIALAPVSGIAARTHGFMTSGKELEPKLVRDEDGNVHNVIGDIQTHKLVGSETGGQITEWVDNVPPGAGIPPHIHTREDEIFRVVKGEVEIMVDGDVTLLKAGDMAFAPRNIPHAWKVVGTDKAKMITSAFPSGIEEMFYELAALPEGPPDLERVAEICARQGIRFV